MNVYLRVIFCLTFVAVNYNTCKAAKDSLYIKTYKNQLIVNFYTSYSLAALEYVDSGEESQTYFPNISADLGIGILWNKFAISTKIYSFKPEREYGETKYFDFQSHWFLSKLQLSLSFQNYKGFYTEDENNNNAIIIRPDLKIKLYRVYGQYLFNHKKFSYRSAFSYEEQQLRSAGSLKAGLGLYYSSVSSDSSLLLNGTVKYPQIAEDYQISPNIGYAYNFIFGKNKRWFANVSFTAGLGISVKNNDDKLKLFPTFYPRMALGYSKNNWITGITVHFLQTQISKMENASTNLNSGLFQFNLAYRFSFK